jgi:hypothetical protein
MIGFDGRHQWRQQVLFKLCAKPVQREKSLNYKQLSLLPLNRAQRGPLSKFAIRSICVRCTKIVREASPRQGDAVRM